MDPRPDDGAGRRLNGGSAASPDRGARRVTVTGGSGFIGTNLVSALSALGHEVQNLDVAAPRDPAALRHWQQVDVRDLGGLRSALQAFQPSWVLHLAARTDLAEGSELALYSSNTDGVRNLVQALGGLDVERVLFTSSSLVFTPGHPPEHDFAYRPTTLYGISKVVGEEIVRAASIEATWLLLRPTSIWGPWFGVPYRNFWDAVSSGRYVHPRGRYGPKSYGYVGNAVHQVLALMQASAERVHERPFWLTDYEPLDLLTWANEIAAEMGARAVRQVPYGLLRSAAGGGDVLQRAGWSDVPLTSFRLRNIVDPAPYDVRELRAVVGPLPYSRQEGVRQTAAWLRSRQEPGSS